MSQATKSVLITGVLGVIGSKLKDIFRARGRRVFGVDLNHHHADDYARCDVGSYRQLERVLLDHGPFDIVYHCAAEFGRWNGEDYYEQLWRTNAVGTKNVIRLQEKLGFRLVHFSSSEVYGDYSGLMTEAVMDEVAIRQMNDYAMTKWVNEMQILNSAERFKTQTVRVRLFNTYGPGEWYSPYRSVNCRFCYCALTGRPITVYRGHQRTSTYLDDTARTLGNIADNFKAGEVYNIGGKEPHDIETLADIIWRITGADRKLIGLADGEILTTKVKMVDVSKAERDLDHRLSVSLDEGVARTLAWMKDYYRL
jgi:dTDP-glucose 4,6-dehydratase